MFFAILLYSANFIEYYDYFEPFNIEKV